MNRPSKTPYELRIDANRRVAAENLKLCPLCGAVNAKLNGECFVCCWQGEFEHDADLIEAGVHELLDQCPELLDVMLEETMKPKLTLWDRIAGFLVRRKNRRSLDLFA